MSKDFDVMRNMSRTSVVLILEEGLGIYIVSLSNGSSDQGETVWLDPGELKEHGVEQPYTYTSIVEIGVDEIILEIGTTYESFELVVSNVTGSYTIKKNFHYMKYLDCQYNRDSQPMYLGMLAFKTCFTKPSVNYLLSGAYPVY